jgi:hypothetical protein
LRYLNFTTFFKGFIWYFFCWSFVLNSAHDTWTYTLFFSLFISRWFGEITVLFCSLYVFTHWTNIFIVSFFIEYSKAMECCEMKQSNVLFLLALFALVFLRISKPKNCVMARKYRIFHNSFNTTTRNLNMRIIQTTALADYWKVFNLCVS